MGKTSAIHHDALGGFREIPDQFLAVRYHSLVGTVDTLPSCLTVTTKTSNGLIMGVRHKSFRVKGGPVSS
jgi:anthranilate/para-aminobenzoate synthase component II